MGNSTAFYYIEANIVCIILFLIMLFRSIRGIDRQFKQNVFNKVMIYHVLYFVSDICWELVATGTIPKNRWTVTIPNLTNAMFLFCLTYYWFYYIEVSQGAKYIQNKRNLTLTLIAGIIPIDISIFLFLFFPKLMINPDYTTTMLYLVLFISAPSVYTALAAIRSLHRAFKKEKTGRLIRILPVNSSVSVLRSLILSSALIMVSSCPVRRCGSYVMMHGIFFART